MATHLVWHEVSGVVVELSEDDLASPLGYLYHPVKTNKNGKHVVTFDGEPVLLDEKKTTYLDPLTVPVPVEVDESADAKKVSDEDAAKAKKAEENK